MSRRLDRAAHLRTRLEQLEAALREPTTQLLPFWRGMACIRDRRLSLLPLADRAAGELLELCSELVFLGRLGPSDCFAVDLSPLQDPQSHPALAGAGAFEDLRAAGRTLPADDAGLALYGRAMLLWHARHGFCSACGGPTAPREGGHMRRCRNEACAIKHFPRTDPAVLVMVTDGEERCLLGRQPGWPEGMYSTLAGFVEPGETLEEAVVREVREEVGLEVEPPHYVRCQPWPFPASLMVGFRTRARTRDIRLDEELEDARWFSRDELRTLAPPLFVPPTFSLSGQLIAEFLAS